MVEGKSAVMPLSFKVQIKHITRTPLKWGTLCLWIPCGSKNKGPQSWKNKKTKKSVYVRKWKIFSFFQLWRIVFLESVGGQRHNVPHFKGLVMLYLDFEAQRRHSTFTFLHVPLKQAFLEGKMAKCPRTFAGNCMSRILHT